MNTQKIVMMMGDPYEHESFPDVPSAISLVQISIELEDINDDTAFGKQVLHDLRSKKPLRGIIKMIAEVYTQDRELISSIVGEKLLKKILSAAEEL